MINIKILGGGCPNCTILYNNVMSSIRELKIKAIVEKIEDFVEISKFGVMSTPALVINEKVVGIGKLNYKKVRRLIEDA